MIMSDEIQEIQEGVQPANLFVIPAEFHEMTVPRPDR
jgi:hypothetical protein